LFNSGLEAAIGTAGSVRLVGPAQVRVLEPDAAWPDIPPSASAENDAPHFELVVQEDAVCGDEITLELDAWAANSSPVTGGLRFRMGEATREFTNDADVGIPLETTVPVTSTIEIDQQQTLAELDVHVWISHQVTEELIVELTSPEGTTVRLHDRTTTPESGVRVRYDLERDPDGPGTMGDFAGESTLGTWTLSIEDVGSASTGAAYLYDWTLYTTVEGGWDCQPRSCSEPPPADAPDLQVEIAADDLVLTWSSVTASGYHVLRSTSASYSEAVELIDRTTTETVHTLVGGVQTTPPLTFFQVRGINSCNHEGP
jgi:subtilisin-like proprotein convertase family protein